MSCLFEPGDPDRLPPGAKLERGGKGVVGIGKMMSSIDEEACKLQTKCGASGLKPLFPRLADRVQEIDSPPRYGRDDRCLFSTSEDKRIGAIY